MNKRIKQLFACFLKDEKGFTLVLVTAGLIVLLGFTALVTDVGLIVANKQKLVNMIDSVALAAAQELPENPAQAVQVAQDYAELNNYDPDKLVINISYDNRSISVSGDKSVNLTLAKVLGISKKTVSASSTAAIEGLSSYTGVVPVTISDRDMEDIDFGNRRTLKYTNHALGPGDFGALALGGNGANTYRSNLADGYSGKLRVGDKVDTEPGNMAGPTQQGVETRLVRCHDGCDHIHFLQGCPRIVIIPVHRYDPNIHGRYEVTIVGFAAFFLADVTNKGEIDGYFIKTVGEGDASPSQVNYGLCVARLVS